MPDAALDDLCEVLFNSGELFGKLRALALLAAGRAVEDLMQQLYEAAGSPKELSAAAFEKALNYEAKNDDDTDDTEGKCIKKPVNPVKSLLDDLQKTSCDRVAMGLVLDAYHALAVHPDLVLALFLLGRAIHDMSLIVNVRRQEHGEDLDSYESLGYAPVGETGLWGRLTVIDTDIKPADRIPKYAKTLRQYLQHQHVQVLLSEMLARGKTLHQALDVVGDRFHNADSTQRSAADA